MTKRLWILGVVTLAAAGVFLFAVPSADAHGSGFDGDGEHDAMHDVLEPLPTTPNRGSLGVFEELLPKGVREAIRFASHLCCDSDNPAISPGINTSVMRCAVPGGSDLGDPFVGTHSDCKACGTCSLHTGIWQSENGQDWGAPAGSRVVAVVDGVIEGPRTSTGTCNQSRFYLRGDDGNRYYYQHMRPGTILADGTRVVAGQQVAEVNGGCPWPDHLHLAIEHTWHGGNNPSSCSSYPNEFYGQDPVLDCWHDWFESCTSGSTGGDCSAVGGGGPIPPPGGGGGGLPRPLPDPFTCAAPDLQSCAEPPLTFNPPGYTQEHCVAVDETCAQGTCFGVCTDDNGNLLADAGSLAGINDDPNPIARLAAVDPSGGNYCSYTLSDRCGDPSQGGACSFILECETHKACNVQTQQCEIVPGRQLQDGEVSCDSDSDCTPSHTACLGNQCVLVPEPGADECGSDVDCGFDGYDCPNNALTIDDCTYVGLTRNACLGEFPAPTIEPNRPWSLAVTDPGFSQEYVELNFSIVWGHVEGLKIDTSFIEIDGEVQMTNTEGLSRMGLLGLYRCDSSDVCGILVNNFLLTWEGDITNDYDGFGLYVAGHQNERLTIRTAFGNISKTLREWVAYDGIEIIPVDSYREIGITAHNAIPIVGPQCALVRCAAHEIAEGTCQTNTCSSDFDCGIDEIEPGEVPDVPPQCPPHEHPNPPYGAGEMGTLEHDGNLSNDDPVLVTHFQNDINDLKAANVGFTFTCNSGLSGCSGEYLTVDGLYGIRTSSAALAYEQWRNNTAACGTIDGIFDAAAWQCLSQDMTAIECPDATGEVICGDGICSEGEDGSCPVDCVLRRDDPLPPFPHGSGGGPGEVLPVYTCSDTDGDAVYDSCSSTGESTILCESPTDCTRSEHSQCVSNSCQIVDGPGINACGDPLVPSSLNDDLCTCSLQSTCGDKYDPLIEQNPANENFGDACCDASESAIFTELQRLDCTYANFWMDIVRRESAGTFSPNVVAGVSTSGSAWGLFQMGHDARDLNGDGDTLDSITWNDPRRGSVTIHEPRQMNNSFDRGDVPWREQVSNAINYNEGLRNGNGNEWCYWAAARGLIPALDSACRSGGAHSVDPLNYGWASAC